MTTKPKTLAITVIASFLTVLYLAQACDQGSSDSPDPKPITSNYPDDPNYDFRKGEAEVISYTERQPSPDEIAITLKYYEIALGWVGNFPLAVIDASAAQPMPVLRTLPDGTVQTLTLEDITAKSVPRFRNSTEVLYAAERGVTQCDKPSAIFRDMENAGCMPGCRIIRVSSESTDWVYVFRKTTKFFTDPNLLEEIGLIAYNRTNGKTAYFAGAESWEFTHKGPWKHSRGPRQDVDSATATLGVLAGKNIPPPNANNPASVKHWRIPNGQGCISCHSAGPFVSYPFSDYKGYTDAGEPIYYTQPESQQNGRRNLGGKFGNNVVPMRSRGLLYEPLIFQDNEEFIAFMRQYRPKDPEDAFYKDIMNEINRAERPKVRRLRNKEVSACLGCHELGNNNYLERFPEAAFSWKGLPPATHERSLLYFANLSETLKNKPNRTSGRNPRPTYFTMAGFHNRKVAMGNQLNDFIPQDSANYHQALEMVAAIAKDPSKGNWQPHWTLPRVQADTWSYIKEVCSDCHNGSSNKGFSTIMLTTQQDFRNYKRKPGKEHVFEERLSSPENPMPPSGLLQESTRELVIEYIQNL